MRVVGTVGCRPYQRDNRNALTARERAKEDTVSDFWEDGLNRMGSRVLGHNKLGLRDREDETVIIPSLHGEVPERIREMSAAKREFKRMPPDYRKKLGNGDWRYSFKDGLTARIIRTNDQPNHIEWRVYIERPVKILVPKPFKRLDEAVDYMCFEYDLPVVNLEKE